MLIVSLFIALQLPGVQTYLAKKGAKYLSKELNTKVDIKSIYIEPFRSIVLEDLYVQDMDKDTLLFTSKFKVDIAKLSFSQRKIYVRKIEINRGRFFLKEYKDKTNLTFIINYFDSGQATDEKEPSGEPYDLRFNEISIKGLGFKYKNFEATEPVKGVNFDDVDLQNLNATLYDLDFTHHLFKAAVRNLSFREKSGFVVNELSTDAVVDTTQMEFKRLNLVTPHSRIRNYLLMRYQSFDDFNDFINKVYVYGNLKGATVDSKDIGYFTEEIDNIKMNMRVGITGKLSGLVNNIRARGCSLKAGQATFIRGDFDIIGLPDADNAIMKLRIAQLATNKKDANLVLKQIVGEKDMIPDFLDKFGNVYFNGSVTGGFYHFTTKGEFKTHLGRVLSDVNLNINGKGAIKGNVRAIDFNLGELLDQESLIGRTTLSANLHGTGLSLNEIQEHIDLEADYLHMMGYRYANIKLQGALIRQMFKGKLNVRDHNLKLSFDGSVDLNKNTPELNFAANIDHANLRHLHITRDTVIASSQITGNFRGDNINNVEGFIELAKLKITNPDTSIVVSSLKLQAKGSGDHRRIDIMSEILDGHMEGQYQISSLPDYLISVAKRYIPSIDYKPKKYAPQHIFAQVNVHDFSAISMLFAPKLKFPEGFTLGVNLSPEENINAVAASGQTIQYGKIKISNFIFDALTEEKQLNIFYTADQIQLTDSLYLKNINIANILRNDSLNFNVKLSDKTAANQLDLNGLVLFEANKPARLNILPSDFIIAGENWKVPEKATIQFEKGKVLIDQFEFSKGTQNLFINGVISSDPADKLTVQFQKFRASTFNPLAKAAGIRLDGIINGDVNINSVTKVPKIEAKLVTDSLSMNNIALGKLDINADMDNATGLVNVDVNMVHDGRETLKITGTYDVRSENNSLKMDVRMNKSELVMLEPFTQGLVSNITGKGSTDLKVSGTLAEPRFNGSIRFENAGFTVDYLKTNYSTNDTLRVENSLVRFNRFNLSDPRNHTATVNGTINLNNLSNPEIDVVTRAQNFWVLNTTSKDNSLYFGTGFATGTFRFKGPIDNMNIDIRAKSEEGTVFNIPLNSSETIGNNDFISFVAKDSTTEEKRNTFLKPGMSMNFDLDINENTLVNLYTSLGKLSARGNSNIIMKVTSSGDFEMFGDYLVTNGKFHFTAQEFINKIFDLRQGGSIRWTTGDPTAAQINLSAVYALRADIRPLYVAAGRAANEGRVQTEAIMKLSGSLAQPEIAFDLDFPSDANIKDELQGYLSDVNNKNSQALSLIVRRSFSPNTGNVSAEDVNNTIASATTELFVNQFNTVLSQMLNLNFVDLNIRSLNEASASFRFMKDRLIVTAGVSDRRVGINEPNVLNNTISRDAELLYLIKKDGSLTARFSNKLNNRNFLNPEQEYISAFGLVYRKDFETFGEFLRALIGRQRREERRVPGRTVPTNTPGNSPPPKAVLPKPVEGAGSTRESDD